MTVRKLIILLLEQDMDARVVTEVQGELGEGYLKECEEVDNWGGRSDMVELTFKEE